MLDKNQDAKFIAFEYPYSANRVRFHRHTDTNELWVVLADICMDTIHKIKKAIQVLDMIHGIHR